MTPKQILQGRILISEFLGKKFYAHKGNRRFELGFDSYKECKKWIKIRDLIGYYPEIFWEEGCGDYDTNYASLMTAVEEIEKCFNDNVIVRIEKNYCEISISSHYSLANNKYLSIFKHTGDKKTSVFNACVEYVKWYKKNNLFVIRKNDKVYWTGGFIFTDTFAIRDVLDSIPKERQYDFIKDIKHTPFEATFYEEEEV